MTLPQSGTTERPLGRDLAYAARYYLRTRWTLVALASLAVVLGLYFGGWAWLVAAGLAPILLSTPCLIMCGLGVCMMCRGQNQPGAPGSDHTGDMQAALASMSSDDALEYAISQMGPADHVEGHFDRDTVDASTSTALDAPKANSSSVIAASCCHDGAVDTQPAQSNQDRSAERSSSHA